MIASLSLAVYLLIGLLYADHTYKDMISEFEEEVDETDPELQDYIKSRNDVYDALHNLHKLVGEKGLRISLYLFYMIFWLPIILYSKISQWRK